MIASLARLIRGSIGQRTRVRRHPTLQELQVVRTALMQCIEDCEGMPVHRLRQKIEAAKSGQELWLLRNDVYQQISQRHTQAVAAERINAMMHCFEGFMDERQLVRIR